MIEAIEGSIEFFLSPSMIAVFGIASSLFFGSIISLITGLALKKNKPA
jgi:predicted membrane protein